MSDSQGSLREGLLAQFQPSGQKLALYREEMKKMLATMEKTLNRQKWYAGATWCFVVLMGTLFLYLGGSRQDTPVGVWLGIVAIFFLIFPAVELIKYFLNRNRVEILKEIKGLELRVMELQEQIRGMKG